MAATTTRHGDPTPGTVDKAQYVLAAAALAWSASTRSSTRAVSPSASATRSGRGCSRTSIGTGMIVLAVLLAVATARGDVAEGEAGEDIDLTIPPDWVTVGKLVGILVLNLLLVNLLGWAITGALLFAGCAWALGSRTLLRDLIVGAVLSVSSWYFFYVGLGVPLPPGILDGIL